MKYTKRACHRGRNPLPGRYGRELHEGGLVPFGAGMAPQDFESKARFSNSAWAREGHQSVGCKKIADARHVMVAAHEARA